MDTIENKSNMAKCIYCQQWKPLSDFNREHVIPRMMGTYDGTGYVLGNYEVCEGCNSYFSKSIENAIALDSVEALLRAQHGTKNINDGHQIGENRLHLEGKAGLFKGLKFKAYSDTHLPERIHLDIQPSFGIIHDENVQEYDYFELDNIPYATKEVLDRIRTSKMPFIFFGYDKESVIQAISRKGYDTAKLVFDSSRSIDKITNQDSIDVQIKATIEKTLLRMAAKTVFNHLCYVKGKRYVDISLLDYFRNFIRYGTLDSSIKINISNGRMLNIPNSVDYAHVVGTLWTSINYKIYLCGFVSWFNKITYTFAMRPWTTNILNALPNNTVTIFDNKTRSIKTEDLLCHIDWPGNEDQLASL